MPRALAEIFAAKARHEAARDRESFDVRVSFLQIYCETIQDLLVPAAAADDEPAAADAPPHGHRTHPHALPPDSASSVGSTASAATARSEAAVAAAPQPENLVIRESPSSGFYVEGLHECVLRARGGCGAESARGGVSWLLLLLRSSTGLISRSTKASAPNHCWKVCFTI